MKPIIKWAGGKHRLINELTNNASISQDNTYYEPFIGGGSLFLHLQPRKWVINDTNPNLINVWKKIKDDPVGLCENLDTLVEEYKNSNDKKQTYIDKRTLYNENIKNKEYGNITQAALFVFLNKTCFNGIYRVNKAGFFNVPWNKNENPFFFDGDAIKQISSYMNETIGQIKCCGWEDAIEDISKDDFVYFDPPYYPENKTSFTTYTNDAFKVDEHEELARKIIELDRKGVNVMLSNSNVQQVRVLYSSFYITDVSVSRSISCKKEKRGRKDCELIITNYLKI